MTDTKSLFYDQIAEKFDGVMNQYDVNRRMNVIFDDFLGSHDLTGKTLLDGGCGTGRLTERAAARGAQVTSVDIAGKLVEITKKRVPACNGIEASILQLPLPDKSFDYVISSDVIEHTPDPLAATKELLRVLKPGGYFCITVPNRTFWYFSLVLADLLKIRPYAGHENWVHYRSYRDFLKSSGVELLDYKGVHLYPFQISALNGILYKLDKRLEHTLGPVMINIAAFGKKPL